MKSLIPAILVALISCNSQQTIDKSIKKYMLDSIVPRFNDPASYQYVSTKIDTFTGSDYLNNLKRSYIDTDTFLLGKDVYSEKQKEFSRLSTIPGYADSVLHLNVEVTYRSKNKMGALILDKTELRYFPKENRITEVR